MFEPKHLAYQSRDDQGKSTLSTRAPEAEDHLALAASGTYFFLAVLILSSFLWAEYFLIGFAHRTPLFPVLDYLFAYK